MPNRSLLSVTLLSALISVGALASHAHAAPPAGVPVTIADVYSVDITVKTVSRNKKGKKVTRNDTRTIACLDVDPGTTEVRDGVLTFLSFNEQARAVGATIKKGKKKKKLSAKKLASLTKKLKSYKALAKTGRPACTEPEWLSLQTYRGPFGEAQAQRLMEVFALGGKPGWVDRAVAQGLEATVNDLLTWKEEPEMDAMVAKLSCDPNPDDDVDDCYENNNANDFYMDGLISAINLRTIRSENPVFYNLFTWAMDQRAPGNPRVLDSENRRYFKGYLALVERFAKSGNYRQYVLDYFNDNFGHGKWLSGVTNHAGDLAGVGNEDFAREAMELLTMGTVDKNGDPNYNDLDVLNASLALSGLAEKQERDSSNNRIKVIGYFPELHAPGGHTLFGGTPYQTTVYNGTDFANALFNVKGKQTAYELAKRLWHTFISSKGTPTSIQKLADLIEANDFNLLPVMRRMMMSKAFYAPESAETILKSPYVLFATYARMTGIPIENYNSLRSWLTDMGMLVGRPPTVFGFSYQNKLLASDVYQLSRFSSIFYYTMWQDLEDIEEETGWTPHNGLIASLPLTGNPATDVVNGFARRLNLANAISPEELAQYTQFIEYTMGDCNGNNQTGCFSYQGNLKRLYRDVPDLGDPDGSFYRERLLLTMLAAKDAFQVM